MADEIIEETTEEAELSFEDAMRTAESGQYEHTLFQMWESMLDEGVMMTENGVSIPAADSILRSWPWLKYEELDTYMDNRRLLLLETKEALQSCYPKPTELLFQENVDDWTVHKDAYLDVIVAWTHLTNRWAEDWAEIPIIVPLKGIQHAVIADTTALILGRDGFIEQMRNLHGFDITDEEGAELTKRLVGEVSDE